MMRKKNYEAGQATDDNMSHANYTHIPETKNTHSEYIIFIAFPLQQGLLEPPSMSHYSTLPVMSE